MLDLTGVAPFLGIFGLVVAFLIFLYVKKQPNGNETMQELEEMIHDGAMAFLKKEYSYLAVFIVIVFILLVLAVDYRTA
ncbi:MAG: sodium/proton-translocating pyrophosphatase, partial [Candidatus Adiutricales bacterium]